MFIGIKNISKFFGVSIISCCAVCVCTLFLNFYIDIQSIENAITSEIAIALYHAQILTAQVVCLITGGCLLLTSIIMLIFYIKHYIDTHKKELGILKALGYSNIKIALKFWIFGLSVLIGTLIGFLLAFAIMPRFYALQNKDALLPEITMHFHFSVFLYFVILPTLFFSLLSIFYTWYKLRKPVLSLLKDNLQIIKVPKHYQISKKETSFIQDLKINTLKSKKVLVFFITFASFCFSAMTQMSFSMKDLSSEMMGIMMLIIGLVLAFSTLFIAITTVIDGNAQTIAMMRVFGYSQKECSQAILNGYRPFSYLGFIIGTIYQYALLRIMVDFVFKDLENVPTYKFDFPIMFISLFTFIIIYEVLMFIYSNKIKKISLKKIMID